MRVSSVTVGNVSLRVLIRRRKSTSIPLGKEIGVKSVSMVDPFPTTTLTPSTVPLDSIESLEIYHGTVVVLLVLPVATHISPDRDRW